MLQEAQKERRERKRRIRKKNKTMGDYVRQWVPELQGIKGGDVHTPWTLSNSALTHAQVSLNETYPSPVVIAPEWSRHINNKSFTSSAARGKKGSSHTPRQHRDRGINFYFSKSKRC